LLFSVFFSVAPLPLEEAKVLFLVFDNFRSFFPLPPSEKFSADALEAICCFPATYATTRYFIYTYFFIKTILQEHEAHFCSKFKNKLRTIQPQPKCKVSNFQLKYSEQTAARAAQFAKCILLIHHVQLLAPSCARTNKYLHFFYKSNFIRTRGSFFAQNLRTIKSNPSLSRRTKSQILS